MLKTLTLLFLALASAKASPILGSAQNFAVLGGNITNAGATTINGDLGLYPGSSITGLGSITLTGILHSGDGIALQAQGDILAAWTTLSAMPATTDLTGQDLGTVGTLTPSIYMFSSSAVLTGALTLDFGNNANSAFVFLVGSSLTTAPGSSVTVINGGAHNSIYWVVGSSATLGTSTGFAGNILADQSVTLNTTASICGRVIALNGAVTLDTNSVSNNCAPQDFGSLGFSGGTDPATNEVPEPSSLWMVGGGFIAYLRRKR